MTRSNWAARKKSKASATPFAEHTWKFSPVRMRLSTLKKCGSSSTIKMRPVKSLGTDFSWFEANSLLSLPIELVRSHIGRICSGTETPVSSSLYVSTSGTNLKKRTLRNSALSFRQRVVPAHRFGTWIRASQRGSKRGKGPVPDRVTRTESIKVIKRRA